jgi:hypothetical protein
VPTINPKLCGIVIKQMRVMKENGRRLKGGFMMDQLN